MYPVKSDLSAAYYSHLHRDFALLFNEIFLIYFEVIFQIIVNPNPIFYHVKLFFQVLSKLQI